MLKGFAWVKNKVHRSWVMFDWANSAYSLVITTAVFPAVFEKTITTDEFLGISFGGSQNIYLMAIACSHFLIMLFTPLLSAMADRSNRRLLYLKVFTTVGALACANLFFFSEDRLGLTLFNVIVASVGFSGSLVFYNAYLPLITRDGEEDNLSALGYAYGYFGSSLLLVLLLVLSFQPHWLGLEDGLTVFKIGFVIVGVWWLGFSRSAFVNFPKDLAVDQQEKDYAHWKNGYRELFAVWKEFKAQRSILLFLRAFFMASLGIQTLIVVAPFYALNVVKLAQEELIVLVLLMQLLGVVGAMAFSTLSKCLGNIKSLMLSALLYATICVLAAAFSDKTLFYLLGAAMGFALAGIQSQSRSAYAKLLPDEKHPSIYFSFYDFVEKCAIVLGLGLSFLMAILVSDGEGGQLKLIVGSLGVVFLIALLLYVPLLKQKRLSHGEKG